GTMARDTLRSKVAMIRFSFREDLRRGVASGCSKTAGTCRELLAGEAHLWTFVRVEGVEPTNNDAERALRHGVIYRKLSGGTESEPGCRSRARKSSVTPASIGPVPGGIGYFLTGVKATVPFSDPSSKRMILK